MTNERLYTTKEVAKILNISQYRPKDGVKRGVLVPTTIDYSIGGKYGRYLYNADAVRDYARVLKITPDFGLVGAEEDEITEDGAIKLTPENFNRIVHGQDENPDETQSGDIMVLKSIMKTCNMELKDVAYILDRTEQSVRNLLSGHAALKFEEFMALGTAARAVNESLAFETADYFANDPERYKKLTSWVPYKKAKLMKEYSDLQARMKQIEKELEEAK